MANESSPLLRPGNAEVLEPESLSPPKYASGTTTASSGRVSAFDLSRGLICVLMAIDHTFFISGKEHPTESYTVHPDRHHLYLSSPYHYMLRFVTHTCAPGFCLLMGLGISYFVESRMGGKSQWAYGKTAKYITIRGFIFMLVGYLSMIPFRASFHIQAYLLIDIIFTLGVDFILAGLLILAIRPYETPRNKHAITATMAIASVLLACLTIFLARYKEAAVVQILWLSGGTETTWYVSRFPPLSWFPLVLYGIAYGRLTRELPSSRTAPVSLGLAVIFLAAFLAVRVPGGWGNLTPVPASWFRKGAAEFFWTNKYCPDLAFLTLFTAANHLFIAIFTALPTAFPNIPLPFGGSGGNNDDDDDDGTTNDRTTWRLDTNRVLLDIGTSPFAFYFIHMYSLMILGMFLRRVGWVWSEEDLGRGYTKSGLGNGIVYWIVYAVFILYMWAVCRAYGRFKSQKSVESLWRYF